MNEDIFFQQLIVLINICGGHEENIKISQRWILEMIFKNFLRNTR